MGEVFSMSGLQILCLSFLKKLYWITTINAVHYTLVQSLRVFHSFWFHRLQHARLPCPSLSPRVCSNSCPLSLWCHSTIPSTISSLSSWLQSFQASGSFPLSWLFISGSQSIGASASVLPMNIQDWFSLGLTDLISLWSKGLSRVFSSTTVWHYQLFGFHPSLQSNSYIHTWKLSHTYMENHSFD